MARAFGAILAICLSGGGNDFFEIVLTFLAMVFVDRHIRFLELVS
jgi:hypothetical protein